MDNATVVMAAAIVTGVFTVVGAILGVCIAYWLNRNNQPELCRKTYEFRRSISDLCDIMEDIHLQFSLTNTILIEPIIPASLGFSKRHSHTSNGYFSYLRTNRAAKIVFKYWDGSDKKRTLKVAVEGNHLAVEVFMLPHEVSDLIQILDKQL